LIKDYNSNKELIPKYAEMFKQANPHFVELKSYMHVGRSTNRLEYSNSLEMDEVRSFASELANKSEVFSVMDESVMSRIVVLQNQERFIDRLIPAYANTN
jgi:tRNA wybutosine-synthesizing protein 1